MGDNKSNQNKSMGLIIALVVAILAAVVVLIIAMISLSQNDGAHGGENTTLYTLAEKKKRALILSRPARDLHLTAAIMLKRGMMSLWQLPKPVKNTIL